jgi:hypothetical protein
VLAALSVCAFSVAAAIFMVVAMDEAFVGVMRISSEPLRNALAVVRLYYLKLPCRLDTMFR